MACVLLKRKKCKIVFLVVLLCRENEPGWDLEIKDDVIEECRKHGGVIHIYVDKNSAQVSHHFHTLAIKNSTHPC